MVLKTFNFKWLLMNLIFINALLLHLTLCISTPPADHLVPPPPPLPKPQRLTHTRAPSQRPAEFQPIPLQSNDGIDSDEQPGFMTRIARWFGLGPDGIPREQQLAAGSQISSQFRKPPKGYFYPKPNQPLQYGKNVEDKENCNLCNKYPWIPMMIANMQYPPQTPQHQNWGAQLQQNAAAPSHQASQHHPQIQPHPAQLPTASLQLLPFRQRATQFNPFTAVKPFKPIPIPNLSPSAIPPLYNAQPFKPISPATPTPFTQQALPSTEPAHFAENEGAHSELQPNKLFATQIPPTTAANDYSFEIVKSHQVTDFITSIEYPITFIQSPTIDVDHNVSQLPPNHKSSSTEAIGTVPYKYTQFDSNLSKHIPASNILTALGNFGGAQLHNGISTSATKEYQHTTATYPTKSLQVESVNSNQQQSLETADNSPSASSHNLTVQNDNSLEPWQKQSNEFYSSTIAPINQWDLTTPTSQILNSELVTESLRETTIEFVPSLQTDAYLHRKKQNQQQEYQQHKQQEKYQQQQEYQQHQQQEKYQQQLKYQQHQQQENYQQHQQQEKSQQHLQHQQQQEYQQKQENEQHQQQQEKYHQKHQQYQQHRYQQQQQLDKHQHHPNELSTTGPSFSPAPLSPQRQRETPKRLLDSPIQHAPHNGVDSERLSTRDPQELNFRLGAIGIASIKPQEFHHPNHAYTQHSQYSTLPWLVTPLPPLKATVTTTTTAPKEDQFEGLLPTSAKKHVHQIIIPYTTKNRPKPFESTQSTTEYTTFEPPFSKWSHSNDVELHEQQESKVVSSATVAPANTRRTTKYLTKVLASNLRELLRREQLARNKTNANSLTFDLLKLRKNIDDWTEQEYTSLSHRPSTPTIRGRSKHIPAEYLTTVAPTTLDYNTISTTVVPAFEDSTLLASINNLETFLQERGSKRFEYTPIESNHLHEYVDTKSMRKRPDSTAATTAANTMPVAVTTTTTTPTTPHYVRPISTHKPTEIWQQAKVSISPQTQEKVYVVTPQPRYYPQYIPPTATTTKSKTDKKHDPVKPAGTVVIAHSVKTPRFLVRPSPANGTSPAATPFSKNTTNAFYRPDIFGLMGLSAYVPAEPVEIIDGNSKVISVIKKESSVRAIQNNQIRRSYSMETVSPTTR